jgi:hypothetical protein
MRKDWRSWPICTNPSEREASAFISPKGDWYNVPYGLHDTFAAEMGLVDPEGWFEINKTSWCYVHFDSRLGMAQLFGRMNYNQFKVLKEFWGAKTDFNGFMTIEQLYYEQRG